MAKYMRTGGRQVGTKNRATIEREARAKAGIAAALEGGMMPLDVILLVMRDPAAAVTERQYEAACAAAPFLHPKLSSTTVDATVRRNIYDFSDLELVALAGADSGEDGTDETQQS